MSKPPQRAASPPAKPATAAAPSRAPAGYSGTPLVRKLGWRDGASVCLIGAPPHFLSLIVTGCLGLAASSAAQAQPAFTMASRSFRHYSY